jgi:CheY-like chemotaxis protein
VNRILLIDDDRHACEALGAALRILGYTPEVCCNGDQAVTQAMEFGAEAAIVDLMLPGTSGDVIVRHLAAPPKRLFCCLATGMADYSLLKRALSAGAWTLLSKPFQLAHLAGILQSGTILTIARNLQGKLLDETPGDSLTITRRGDTPVNAEDIARVMQYARRSGADEDTIVRRLPIVVYELLSNARAHGAGESSEGFYRLNLTHDKSAIYVRVADSGQGFPWRKELIRVRTNWDKTRASGLQLVTALSQDIQYDEGEFTASVSISKASEYEATVAQAATGSEK